MPNLNKPLENPLATVFDFKTLFNDEIFDEGYEVTCNHPTYTTNNVSRGGVIRLGANGNTGVYYLRFYMPSAPDVPADEADLYAKKMIMTYSLVPWTYNGVATSGYIPDNYDGFADITSSSELAAGKNEMTGRSYKDRLKEWVTQTAIAGSSNANSLPSDLRKITFTVIGKTTKNRNKIKTFAIDFTHTKPV